MAKDKKKSKKGPSRKEITDARISTLEKVMAKHESAIRYLSEPHPGVPMGAQREEITAILSD